MQMPMAGPSLGPLFLSAALRLGPSPKRVARRNKVQETKGRATHIREIRGLGLFSKIKDHDGS